MKKKNVILLIMLASVLMLFAQNNKRQQRPDAKQIMENLTSSLELTSEQQESISPLVDEQFELMKSHGEPGKSQSKGDREKFKNSKAVIKQANPIRPRTLPNRISEGSKKGIGLFL